MVWFFIAGFISGIVGTLMLGRHIANKIERNDDHEV